MLDLHLAKEGTTILGDFDLASTPLTAIFAEAGLAKNGKQVKDALSRQAVFANGRPISWEDNMRAADLFKQANARYGKYHLVKLGKKSYQLFIS